MNELDKTGLFAIFWVFLIAACFFGAVVSLAELNVTKFIIFVGVGLLAFWFFRKNARKRDSVTYGSDHVFGKEPLDDKTKGHFKQ